jgi:hypothetical protein
MDIVQYDMRDNVQNPNGGKNGGFNHLLGNKNQVKIEEHIHKSEN